MRDGNSYPVVVAHIDGAEAIQRLRELRTVDFVEPLCFQLMQSGCSMPAYSPSSNSAELDQNDPPVPGGGSSDLIPWAYRHLGVTEAWGREALPGMNMRVGVVDTGVFSTQQQLTNFFPFQRGFSASHLTVMSTLEDNCGHGTRIAGLIAAPKDGRNIMGIAWGAPLTTVRCNDDVVHDSSSRLDLSRAIQKAHDSGARIINLALGMTYASGLISDKIKDVFDDPTTPPTIFVAAAGTNLPGVVFPATMDREVVAASTVEVNPGATSSQPQFKKTGWAVVAYGNEVDFVGVSAAGELGVPTTGKIGNGVTEEIVTIGGSSTSTAQLSGIFSLAWSRNSMMTRSALMSRMEFSARRNNISGLNYYATKDTDVGWGLPDAYAAAGGMRNLTIQGPSTVLPGGTLILAAISDGVDFNTYNYSWSGAVPLTTGRFLTMTAPTTGGTTLNFTVLATDPLDGRFLTASHSVLVTQTHLRQLESDEVVDHFSICCIGGKDDTIVYAGTMPAGCSWTSLGGEEYDSSDNKLAFPMPTVKHGSAGFTVSPRGGYTSRDLVANVHTWWDGGGHIRLRASWTVAEPQGVDCSIGTFTH